MVCTVPHILCFLSPDLPAQNFFFVQYRYRVTSTGSVTNRVLLIKPFTSIFLCTVEVGDAVLNILTITKRFKSVDCNQSALLPDLPYATQLRRYNARTQCSGAERPPSPVLRGTVVLFTGCGFFRVGIKKPTQKNPPKKTQKNPPKKTH